MLAFVVAVLAIVGLTLAAITYYARDSYFVSFHGNSVAIYRGHPGGVLWIEPELVETTSLSRASVPAAYLDEIGDGKVEPSLDDARSYVTNVQDVAASQQSGDQSTTTTSTTAGDSTTVTTATSGN